MKRITWYPQFWLGLNFNWGLLVGYYTVSDIEFDISILLFYLGSIFLTIAYDTIYGFQDIKDDMNIGIRSTSIKFRRYPKKFLLFNYFLCLAFWSFSLLTKESPFILAFLLILFIPLILNVLKIDLSDPLQCEKSFKKNSYFGIVTTIFLITLNII